MASSPSQNMALSGTWRTPPADAAADEFPLVWGKYTLVRRLAKGGMAELFLAIQRSMAGFEKLVVIKRILPEMHRDEGFISMLMSEARVAATLSHPNIVQTFDVGEVDGTPFIAMEHVNGDDIRGVVRQMKKVGRQDFPLGLAIEILKGITAGLAYAHERADLGGTQLNIVHRDISPQNVVLTYDGDVKIVDFGIAKSDSKMQQETKSGRLKGKIPYMSPEQARGEEVDGRSDIFSAGILLFELTTGRRLFKGSSDYETLKLICDEDYPRPTEVRSDYPPALETIVMKALAKDRDVRYGSARDFQRDLETFARTERLDAGSVALSEFMRSLFSHELEAQKADKELLQRVRQSHPDDTGMHEAAGARTTSTPAGARTVTEVTSVPFQQRARKRTRALAAAALLVLGAGGGILYAQASGKAQAPSPVSAYATLAIESDPSVASVWVSGELQGDKTPVTLTKLPLGKTVEIRVTKEGFESAQKSIELRSENEKTMVVLEKGKAALEVTTEPKTAIVIVDGKPFSGSAQALESGEHEVLVKADGFEDTLDH
jgi:eukaryotic-like serine/threonine-protein kinase